MVENDRMDPEVSKIEHELINELLKHTIFTIRGKITSEMLFYFVTRKCLTQLEFQNLTGYSTGKISMELKNFLNLGIIEISKKSKPWVYSMESLQVEIFSRTISLLRSNLKWEAKFLEIKKELADNKEELEKENGYDKIKSSLEDNLRRFAGFKVVVNLWEDLKKKYTAEYDKK